MIAQPPRLRTARLELVPFGPGDAPAIFGYAAEPEFLRYLPHPERPYSIEEAQEHLEELLANARRGYFAWRIVAGTDTVGAVRFRPDGACHELGYGLATRAWRLGFATEACRAVLAWTRGQVPCITARCHPDNLPSVRVLERLGFGADGHDEEKRLRFRLPARDPSES